jgi:hypothetical protein
MDKSRRRLNGRFAAIPQQMWLSEARRTLPAYAVAVLMALTFQFTGSNNGDLALTWSIARRYGINSKQQFVSSLTTLQERGLIQKTRQGGKKPLGPSLYALTWLPIDECEGKIECVPTLVASNAWANWSSAPQADQSDGKSSGPQADQKPHLSAPQADQKPHLSAPQADQRTRFIGTTGGPPLRLRSTKGRQIGSARSSQRPAAVSALGGPAGRQRRR